jgi:hypothetical protein
VGSPLELPQRCLQLIDSLWNHAEGVLLADNPKLGPLPLPLPDDRLKTAIRDEDEFEWRRRND